VAPFFLFFPIFCESVECTYCIHTLPIADRTPPNVETEIMAFMAPAGRLNSRDFCLVCGSSPSMEEVLYWYIINVYMNVCSICICVCINIYLHTRVHLHAHMYSVHTHTHYICTPICMHMDIYIWIFLCICIYLAYTRTRPPTHRYKHLKEWCEVHFHFLFFLDLFRICESS